MLIQHEMFFEKAEGEAKHRGLTLIAIIRALIEDHKEALPPKDGALSYVIKRKRVALVRPFNDGDKEKAVQLGEAGKKLGWRLSLMAKDLKVSRHTVRERLRKYHPLIHAMVAVCLMILCGNLQAVLVRYS